MPDPYLPGVVSITGSSNSVVGDTIKVTVYRSSSVIGTQTTTLDTSKEAVVDMANAEIYLTAGDVIVIQEQGSSLGVNSVTTLDGGGAEISVTGVAIAFPS